MYTTNITNSDIKDDSIENLEYGSSPIGSSSFGSSGTEGPRTCPISLKYSGDDITLQSTPKDGTGPYYIVFRKNDIDIDPSRLKDEFGNPASNPTSNFPENATITRVYTLDDVDIAEALTGTIKFSVFMQDSCPTTAQTCEESCIISTGCMAPVCNFKVT